MKNERFGSEGVAGRRRAWVTAALIVAGPVLTAPAAFGALVLPHVHPMFSWPATYTVIGPVAIAPLMALSAVGGVAGGWRLGRNVPERLLGAAGVGLCDAAAFGSILESMMEAWCFFR